jgi:glycosyltransferase involved in cell wall biosynthesis
MKSTRSRLRVVLAGEPGTIMDTCVASLGNTLTEAEKLSAEIVIVDASYPDATPITLDPDSNLVFVLGGTLLTQGALAEMLRIAASDSMIAFVAPRTNGEGISTLPHVSPAGGQPIRDKARFDQLSRRLPSFGLVPFVTPSALWVSGRVLAEFGPIDWVQLPRWLEGLQMRANRCGYRIALANYAYAWQPSPMPSFRTGHLDKDFVERDRLRHRHEASPEYRAEALLGELVPAATAIRVTLDLSAFTAHHNGTFEAGIRLLESAVNEWSTEWLIDAIMTEGAWTFHGMNRFPRIRRIDLDDSALSAVVLRIGQPFTTSDLVRIYTRAPVVAVYMLDTISYDCGYIAVDFNPEVWRIVLELSDLILTNSDYTLERIRARFTLGDRVGTQVSRHSLDPGEYAPTTVGTLPDEDRILVIGNHYAHKFVAPTVDAIAAALPEKRITAVGYSTDRATPSQVTVYSSGDIDQDAFDRFYAESAVVVFPSHYEGFGFPILHALARRRPIFVRDTSLNRELAARIATSVNIYFYATTAELVAALATTPTWSEVVAPTPVHSWAHSAREIAQAIDATMATANSRVIVDRLRRIDTLTRIDEFSLALLPREHRAAFRLASILNRALRLPAAVARCLAAFDYLRRRKRSF